MDALLELLAALPPNPPAALVPIDVSVCDTPGRPRMSRAIRSPTVSVAASDVPSGARTVTEYWDWSSVGTKLFPTSRNSGIVLSDTTAHKPTIDLRCAMDHSSMRV